MKKKQKKTGDSNQAQLLIVLLGVLLVIGVYFFVYKGMMEQAEAQENQNRALATEVARLQQLYANKDTYLADTTKMKNYINEFESRFPANLLPEDSIMMVKHMEDNTRTTVSNISFGTVTPVTYVAAQTPAQDTAQTDQNADALAAADAAAGGTAATGTATAGTAGSGAISTEAAAYADTTLYQDSLGISIGCTYDDFKGLIRYIYSQKERMTVRSVSISYNQENGELSGNMSLDTYFLLGTDKMYTEPSIPSMGMGVDTIFGNME